MEQNKRTAIYFQFVEKKSAVLFSTDISARGVDFPAVDWVVQVDCPEDVNTYIHRVGRTARYKSKGNALLMLLPSETKFLEKLTARNIQQKKLNARSDRQLTIQPVLAKLNAESNDLQHLAKRACASYLRSVFLMKDKTVFDVHKIDTAKLATAYGLLNAPQINVVQKEKDSDNENEKVDKIKKLRMEAKARKLASKMQKEMLAPDSDEEEDFFTAKAQKEGDQSLEEEQDLQQLPALSKRKIRKIHEEGPYAGKNILVFDSQGKAVPKSSLTVSQKNQYF